MTGTLGTFDGCDGGDGCDGSDACAMHVPSIVRSMVALLKVPSIAIFTYFVDAIATYSGATIFITPRL